MAALKTAVFWRKFGLQRVKFREYRYHCSHKSCIAIHLGDGIWSQTANTRWREDNNFMFEWQEQNLEWAHEHENVKFISWSWRVMFFLFIAGQTARDDCVLWRFTKISYHFPKILQNLSEAHANVAEYFSKISEDWRRHLRTIWKIRQSCPGCCFSLNFKKAYSQKRILSFAGVYATKHSQ